MDRSGANPVRRVRTSPWPRWIARAILIACFQMSAAPSALATVIYEYTGNPFTFAPPLLPQGPGPPAPNPFTTDDFVFGSMTFTNPLPPDLPLQPVTPFAVFGAGPLTIFSVSAVASSISVATDSQGDIVQWQILLGAGDVSLRTVSCDFPTTPGCDSSPADSVFPGDVAGVLLADVSDDPGSWATIPEPSTALLLGFGMAAIALGRLGSVNTETAACTRELVRQRRTRSPFGS